MTVHNAIHQSGEHSYYYDSTTLVMFAARIDIALASTVDLLLNKYYTKSHRAMTQRNTCRCLPNRDKM